MWVVGNWGRWKPGRHSSGFGRWTLRFARLSSCIANLCVKAIGRWKSGRHSGGFGRCWWWFASLSSRIAKLCGKSSEFSHHMLRELWRWEEQSRSAVMVDNLKCVRDGSPTWAPASQTCAWSYLSSVITSYESCGDGRSSLGAAVMVDNLEWYSWRFASLSSHIANSCVKSSEFSHHMLRELWRAI